MTIILSYGYILAKVFEKTRELVDTFIELSKNKKYHVGFSVLYCYKSMVSEISENKIDSLKQFYGTKDDETLKFFLFHLHADKWPREVVKNLFSETRGSDNKNDEALGAADQALNVSNNVLKGIMERVYC
jgi:pyrroloquinoline quinone (PQQ) biosynthesis protein C|tara:strand:- start:866 stop:1255 length:390 start_codon:yes stop_codon:yes gene_type:complete